MTTLLLRPPAHKSEGPSSYRMRLAEANILPFHMVDDEDVYGPKDSPTETHIWQVWLGLKQHTGVWLHRHARWCPRCLSDHGFGRVGWELLFADACAECGDWLKDVCHQCGASATWKRNSLTQCSCGANLTDAPSTPAPTSVVRLSKTMEQLVLGSLSTELPQLAKLSPVQASKLVRLLGAYGSPRHQRTPQKIAAAQSLDRSWTISSVAAEVLATWPLGLHHLLERQRLLAAGQVSSGRLPNVFGGFYRALYVVFKDPAFDWLRMAFEDYIAESWSGAMGRRNLRMPASLWSRLTWVPLSAAASHTGLSKRRLLALIRQKKLRAESRYTASGREFVVVRRADTSEITALNADHMTVADAANRLGMKRQRLSRLLPTLCPEASKLTHRGTPWLIPQEWVHKWMAKLHELPEIRTAPSWMVSLDHVLRYGPLDEQAISRLLKDVELGGYEPAGRQTDLIGLPSLVFNRNQLLAKYATPKSSLLTIPEVAIRLGVKQEVAYAIVRLGLLEVEEHYSGRRSAKRVNLVELQKFIGTYAFASDVAKTLGRSARAVIAALAAEEVRMVAGPHLQNCRQAIYLRKDLHDIAWFKYANIPL